jgi:hypothetical protein
MSPAFTTRRRAEQFDALLDGTLAVAPPAGLAGLLALVDQVRAVPEVAPRAEFAASLRARLMAEAPDALAAAAVTDASRLTVGRRTPSRVSRERRISVAVAAFSLVGASAASAVASQGALPGDTLYPVKRLIEDARTSLTMGDDAKADVLLAHARTRLEEARKLGGREDLDPAAITQALDDYGDSADHASTLLLAEFADGGDESGIGELRTFTHEGVTTLGELVDELPVSVHDALADVVNTLLTIDHSAAEACPGCGTGITELPTTLVDLLSATSNAVNQVAGSITHPQTTDKSAGKSAGKSVGKSAGKHETVAPGAEPSPAPDGTLLEQLTDPLTNAAGGKRGDDKATQPSSGPTSLGEAVGGVGGAVGGTVGGTVGQLGGTVSDLGDDLGGPLGPVVGDLGDTVDDLGGTVDNTVGGVGDAVGGLVGGLLGSGTQTPKP